MNRSRNVGQKKDAGAASEGVLDVLRVALSALGLDHPAQDLTLDGDRPGGSYVSRLTGPEELHRQNETDADPGFADWLGKTLHETYDSVAREPLPRELASLIRQLERTPPDA